MAKEFSTPILENNSCKYSVICKSYSKLIVLVYASQLYAYLSEDHL